jgi:bisanhydrobacterioruberin hydratase
MQRITVRGMLGGAVGVLYLVLWIGGVVSYTVMPAPPPEARWAAPVFLTASALYILIAAPGRTALWLLAAGLLGFFIEVFAVNTGFPFGMYSYTDSLQPSVFRVPAVMCAAWISLLALSRQTVLRLRGPRWRLILLASVMMVIFDLVIDPVAAGPLHHWRWNEAGAYYGIPFSNFIGWFLASICINLATFHKMDAMNRKIQFTGLSVLLFFMLIAIAKGMILVSVIGLFTILGVSVACDIISPYPLGRRQ